MTETTGNAHGSAGLQTGTAAQRAANGGIRAAVTGHRCAASASGGRCRSEDRRSLPSRLHLRGDGVEVGVPDGLRAGRPTARMAP